MTTSEQEAQRQWLEVYLDVRRSVLGLPPRTPTSTPRETWEREISTLMAQGRSRSQAIQEVMRARPDLVAALNQEPRAAG